MNKSGPNTDPWGTKYLFSLLNWLMFTEICTSNNLEYWPQESTIQEPLQHCNTKCKEIKPFHQNINWLSNKTYRLTHFLSNYTPEIIVVTEHGLTQENLKNTNIEGYSLIRGFSRKNHSKGGVAWYINKALKNM